MPRRPGEANWLLLEFSDGLEHPDHPAGAAVASIKTEHRTAPFDVDAVARDLRARLHPNAEFLEAVLTGKRQQYAHSPAGAITAIRP